MEVSEKHQRILDALKESNGVRQVAADLLGIRVRRLYEKLREMRAEGIEVPPAVLPPTEAATYATSTLYQRDGEDGAILEWVKRDHRRKVLPEEFAEAVRTALLEVSPAPVIPAPKDRMKDLLAVYPIGDQHVGMYAWAEEAGADYDIGIAKNLLLGAVRHLVNETEPAEEAVLVDVGDFAHYDTITAETVRSKNALDADSRYHVMVRAVLQLLCASIDLLLEKHKRVTVICSPGNHNDMGAAWAIEALAMYYRKNKRVTIMNQAGKFHYYEFGKVLLGVTHGDTGRPDRLQGVMAADQPEAWGRTRHRHWLTGHVHNKSQIEFPGVLWETFRTLAGRDAWAQGGGYRSGRDMLSIVYHREYGEVRRHRFDLAMLED